MPANILITGAAGYIGGSLIEDFLASKKNLFKKENIWAAVRSKEQLDALSTLGINVIRVDLSAHNASIENVLINNNITIVIHTVSSIDPGPALNIITALGKQKEVSGDDTYFIQTSGMSAFYESSGWTHGPIKDSDDIYQLEKELSDSFPVRKTDVAIIEHAKEVGVTSFLVFPPIVYGKGRGQWNTISTQFPACIRASIANKVTHKFAPNTITPAVHISDLTNYYELIVGKILKKERIPSGETGYYFPLAHDIDWWETLDRLAVALHARGLVQDSKTEVWPTDEMAAKSLNFTVPYVRIIWNSGTRVSSKNNSKLGWKPQWNRDKLEQNLDEEIRYTLELGEPKSSLFQTLNDYVEQNVKA